MVPAYTPGNFRVGGRDMIRAGFMDPGVIHPEVGQGAQMARAAELTRQLETLTNLQRAAAAPELKRFDVVGSVEKIANDLRLTLGEVNRAIVSTTTGFPIRENLEAPARILVPLETPIRNMLPRTVGSGLSSAWRQITSLGGGYGFLTTITTGTAANATQPVGSTAGMRPGDVIQISSAAGVSVGARTILTVNSATSVTFTAIVTTTTGDIVVNTSRPVGAGAGTQAHARTFISETGASAAPAAHDTVWASKSATYKMLAVTSGISGLAAAAGRSYGDPYAQLKRNLLLTCFLAEENALVNGSASATYPPWGDGTLALGFDGLLNLVSTANGTPAHQIQGNVGPLTLSHIDRQLAYLFEQGGTGTYMIVSPDVALSLVHLAEAAGSIIRLQATKQGEALLGLVVNGYVHPISGEVVPVMCSRFLAGSEPGSSTPTGTIIFGSKYLPDGTPAADVSVLPQLAGVNFNEEHPIMGYTAVDVAPGADAPFNYVSAVAVFEVLRLISANHFCKSTGLSPV